MIQRISRKIIHYSLQESKYGLLLIASTEKGICLACPVSHSKEAISILMQRFPKDTYLECGEAQHQSFVQSIHHNTEFPAFDLYGTPFQMKVWRCIQRLKPGETTTYQSIAQQIGHPKACRAVGTALGANPIFYGIPCHRVLSSNGNIGGYKWGSILKNDLLKEEISSTKLPNR